ncbi:hypothetical protein [Microtetraspora malaysiensis]|uniref:hypothetical protein n=1 Tax=Microtetraspora malaysiensis TaxID=161358 RepID=UPI00082EAFD1|nr:hypothetical protein [Microtetraspora malaysiensis]
MRIVTPVHVDLARKACVDSLIRWMIDQGHLSEATYALQEINKVSRSSEKAEAVQKRLRPVEKTLKDRLREASGFRLSDSPPAGPPEEPHGNG